MTSPAAGETAPLGAPPKRRIRNYLLDPSFQLKYTAIIVVVAVVLMAGLGLVIMRTANTAATLARTAAGQARTAARQAQEASEQAERAMRESQTSSRIMRMNQLMQAADNPDLVHTIEQQLGDDDRLASRNLDQVRGRRAAIEQQSAQIAPQEAQIERTRRLTFLTLLVTGILLVFLLGFMGIVITHKVVGPVFKLKRLLRQVGTGRVVIKERLRRGDELEDLFDTFLAMVESLRAAQETEMARLDAAIEAAEAANTAPHAIEKFRELRAEMRLALGNPESHIPPAPR